MASSDGDDDNNARGTNLSPAANDVTGARTTRTRKVKKVRKKTNSTSEATASNDNEKRTAIIVNSSSTNPGYVESPQHWQDSGVDEQLRRLTMDGKRPTISASAENVLGASAESAGDILNGNGERSSGRRRSQRSSGSRRPGATAAAEPDDDRSPTVEDNAVDAASTAAESDGTTGGERNKKTRRSSRDGSSLKAKKKLQQQARVTIVEPNRTTSSAGRATGGLIGVWFDAVNRGDLDAVQGLVDRNFDVNVVNEQRYTALHLATEARNDALIELLCSASNVNVDQRGANGETALHIAARAADRASVRRLLAAGADVNAAMTDDSCTPLHCACQNGDGSKVVRLLLAAGARPDAGRRSARSGVVGITPMHDAADVGDIKSVKVLLDHDEALADDVTDRGCTALHVAARHGYQDVVDELISRRAFVAQPGSDARGLGVQALHLAAESGHAGVVRSLLAGGADPNAGREYCSKTGVTALHLAVMRNHLDVVRLLLDAGASANAADVDGSTALHVAARGGGVEATRMLVESAANVDAGTRQQGRGHGQQIGQSFGQTPLHFAVRYRHIDVVRLLLDAGCDVNAAEQMSVSGSTQQRRTSSNAGGDDENVHPTSTFAMPTSGEQTLVDGYTALHWATENADLEIVRLLLEHDANPDLTASFDTHAGVTALHLAAQDGYAEVAAELLSRGASRDPRKRTRNRENITPLHQAVYNGHLTTVKVLLDAGCDPNVQADNGYAALHYAAQKGNLELTLLILNSRTRSDVTLRASTRDQADITAMHLAVQSGNVEVVRMLAAAGAPIDAGKQMGGGVSGVTALHQAVYQEKADIVDVLLELGADPDRSMNGWYTPLHVAAEKGCVDIARRLLRADGGGRKRIDARATLGDHIDLTPLHVAAQHGHEDLVQLLADSGADLQATRKFVDRSNITTLHLAAENGFLRAVQTLLRLLAAAPSTPAEDISWLIDAQDSLGFSALHLAVQYQFPDVVEALLSAGANASLRTSSGLTAMRIAEQLDNVTIERLLAECTSPSPTPRAATSLRAVELSPNGKPAKRHGKTGLRGLLCGVRR